MKLEKDAVTIVGFSTIFILILLIITPPTLRLMFGKDEVNNSDKVMVNLIQRLECNKKEDYDGYSLIKKVNTVYNGNSIDKITFNYNIEFSKAGLSVSDVYIYEYEMLKQIPGAIINSSQNSFIIEFDYDKADYEYNEFLNKYSKDISSQKSYYEGIGYTCSVVK